MWAFFPHQLTIGFILKLVKFMDKTPQIAEEQLVMMMDQSKKKQSFKDTKVSILVFSADISKSEEISRWRPVNKT